VRVERRGALRDARGPRRLVAELRRAGGRVDTTPSRFLKELAQDDLRWAGAPLPPDEAAREKDAGLARLRSLKAALGGNGE